MKLALNGALTIGTMDGANIEIREEVGDQNIFIFGLKAEEVMQLRREGYNPYEHYFRDPELRAVIDQIAGGHFSPHAPGLFQPIADNLLRDGDPYMLIADFRSYLRCQETVARLYRNQDEWTTKSILNVAGMGKFSSDRTVREYAEEIWKVSPVSVSLAPDDERA